MAWLKKRFPTLFEIWQKTEVKDTGNAIARKYEHELILHKGLYDHAEKLGLKVMSEHDGVGVFAKDDDMELQSKLDSIAKYLQTFSSSRFGVPIFVKPKLVFDWSSVDLMQEMQHKLDQLGKEYSKLKPIVNRRQRQYFATGREEAAGQAYAEATKKEHELLRRYKDVLAYWVERERQNLC